jgi:L-rhamnose mutarotase
MGKKIEPGEYVVFEWGGHYERGYLKEDGSVQYIGLDGKEHLAWPEYIQRAKNKNVAVYALYKGDTFITTGTAPEIARQMGVTEKTVYWWSTPTNIEKRPAKNKRKHENLSRKILVRIE